MERKKEIIFAVPGSKKYVNSFYSNSTASFKNFSITGNNCELECAHCKKKLLDTMNIFDKSADGLNKIISEHNNNRLKGILLSGGFDRNGKLPIYNYLGAIKELKRICPGLIILAHLGFTDHREAEKIKESGIDFVLVNMISGKNAIENIYNLKNRTGKDYINTIKILEEAGNNTVPHIIAGIDSLKTESDYEALNQLAEINISRLVFIIIKKLDRDSDVMAMTDYEELTNLIKYAKKTMPDTKISLGCSSPSSKKRGQFEIGLIKNDIDCISFPSQDTVSFCNDKKIPYRFEEMCCAALL